MSKKPASKKTAKAIVKPPRVAPRQPKLKNRKRKKGDDSTITVSVGQQTQFELGPRLMPTADLALEVLEEVAVMNDATLKLEAEYKAKAEEAKEAKKRWQDKLQETQRHIRLNTHESSLPLIAEAEREADAANMEAAIKAGGEL